MYNICSSMPKKFITEVLATIARSKIKSVIILDIENSQQFIPELFTLSPEALFVTSVSRTQTYSLKKIESLAEAIGIILCSDLFSGQRPDKADKRLTETCKAISEAFAGIKISAYTMDVGFAKELNEVGVRIENVNPCFNLTGDELKRLSGIRNPLVRRYMRRREKFIKGR